jgi:hypothetical protein
MSANRYTVRCSCGWTSEDEYALRSSAVKWKQWHLFQVTPRGSRPSDTGHHVEIIDNLKGKAGRDHTNQTRDL